MRGLIRAWVVSMLIGGRVFAQSYDPGYGMLALQEDPWTYATGAGPAGGWGIGASSANPASSSFGPEATFTVSPLSELLMISGGGRLNSRWAGGVTVARMVDLDQNNIKVFGPAARYRDEIEPGDMLLRVNGSALVSKRAAIGANVKYSRTFRSFLEAVPTGYDWWYVSREAEMNVVVVDVGFRIDGVLPSLTLLARRGSMIPTSETRWPSGLSFGISAINLPLMTYGDLRRDDDAVLWLSTGLAYRPVITRAMCVSLNAAYYFWPGTRSEAPSFGDDLIPTKNAYSFGTDLEFNELLELGFALYGPQKYVSSYFYEYGGSPRYYVRRGLDIEFYGGLGPPWLRFLASAGSYGDGSYINGESDELTGRFWIRIQLPFGERQREDASFFN